MTKLVRSVSWAVGLISLALAAPTRAEATPVSILFTGSVSQTFDGTLVPQGTPATILLQLTRTLTSKLERLDDLREAAPIPSGR